MDGDLSPAAALLCWYQDYLPPPPEPEAIAPRPVTRQALPLSDHELLDRARTAANGAKFWRLWQGDTSWYGGDRSRADLALVALLLWWTGGDVPRTDSLFRRSGLMRRKWDEHRGASTYGQRTIAHTLVVGGAGAGGQR